MSNSAKADGREPKTGLGQVFNYKLGCYDDVHAIMYTETPFRKINQRSKKVFEQLSSE